MELKVIIIRERAEPLALRLSEEDIAAHREFVVTLGESALWRDYRPNAG
jgi:hypothetical protein